MPQKGYFATHNKLHSCPEGDTHTHTHKYTHMYTLLVRERGDEDGGETVTEDREREKVTFSERAGGGE